MPRGNTARLDTPIPFSRVATIDLFLSTNQTMGMWLGLKVELNHEDLCNLARRPASVNLEKDVKDKFSKSVYTPPSCHEGKH